MKTLATLALGVVLMQATPPPPTAPGTAILRGTVIDKESAAPIVRAVVSLRGISRQGLAVQNLTDERGTFEFRQLAAGPYELRASAGEYRATHVPMSYPTPTRPGVPEPLQVKDGEQRTDIVIALPRAYAISGRVTDDNGSPLAHVDISLPRARFDGGSYFGSRSTDDNGNFRVFGLGPGRYTVCADSRRGASFDRQSNRRLQYVRTCYPSALDETEASEISVAQGDVDGVEIRMQRRPLFLITGQVITAAGVAPENAQISLTRIEGNGASGTSTKLAADGSFRISNVVPGTYEVSAQLGRSERNFGELDERETQWGGARFEVTTSDVEGVILTLKTGATVKGRLVYEDPPQDPPTGQLQVVARTAGPSSNRPSAMPATVAEDGTFELKGLFGELIVSMSGSPQRGYVVKSVLYKGKDVAWVPTEFDGDPAQQIQVVLTSRTATLSGQVIDDAGIPVVASVIAFPADPSRWRGFQRGYSSSGPNGRYRLMPQVAGEYFIAALKAADLDQLTLPDDFDRLATVAERVTLLENDRRTADLRVVTVPPRSKRR